MQFTRDLLFITEKSDITEYRVRAEAEKTAVHWGERKLLINEIEFLSLFWKPTEIPKPQCVYIGAAPGTHIDLLARLYPEIAFHLYDPREFVINDYLSGGEQNVKIYTGDQGLFTDEIARSWSGRDDVIMISDIRAAGLEGKSSKEYDDVVIRDMNHQQRWYSLIKPRIASLKFRLPYYNPGGATNFAYLNGYVLKGVWPLASSTETRLVPVGESIREWDLKWYEQALAYHNQHFREGTTFFNLFTNLLEPIDAPELLNDFDSTAEAFILRGYLRTRNPDPNIPMAYVIALSKYITNELNGWSSIRTTIDILRKTPGHSTVIRQQLLHDPQKRGLVKPIYQRKTRGRTRTASAEEEAKQELLPLE